MSDLRPASPKAVEDMKTMLTRARQLAAREVVMDRDGAHVLDALRRRHDLTVDGRPWSPDRHVIREVFDETSRTHGSGAFGSWGSVPNSLDVPGHGEWAMTAGDDGSVSLKPRKPFPATLEQLVSADGAELELVRSMYGIAGVDVVLAVEGKSRASELAGTIAAEMSMAGIKTRYAPLPRKTDDYLWRPEGYFEGLLGPDVLDANSKAPGHAVEVETILRRHQGYGAPDQPTWQSSLIEDKSRPGPAVRVFEVYSSPLGVEARLAKELEDRALRAVVVLVGIENSKAVARVVATPALRREAALLGTPDDAPWKLLNERRSAATASRSKTPVTWHQTTQQVADAFVERKAPRGYVSSKSIYFHGPVAFAIWTDNPIAAFVDVPGGKAVMFMGRAEGIGGTKAGTVSSAQGDLARAAGDRFEIVTVDSLAEFLSLGDRPVDALAETFRHRKNEDQFPSTCKVDARKLKAWFGRKVERAEADLEKAMKVSVPTYSQSGCHYRLAGLAEDAARLSSLLRLKVEVGHSPEDHRSEAVRLRLAADERQSDLAERRRAAGADRGTVRAEDGEALRPPTR